MARFWGMGTSASSDGQFFVATEQGEAMNLVNAKYGNTPGLKAYSHVSDQYAPFATQVIPATASEAPYILDGLLMNDAGRHIREQFTDTGGFTDHSLPVIHMGISNRAYEITPCSVLTDSLRSEWAEPARLAKIGRSDRIHGLRDRLQNSGQFGFRQVLQRDTLCTAGDAIGQALAEFPNVKHFRNRERGRCKVPINITIFVETIGAAIYPQDISTPSYIEAESTRFFALRELHQVGDAVELFDQKLLDRRRGEFRLFHISLPPDERLLRHSPSAVPIGSAVQMRDFR
ncbi:Tn3 family transposase [Acinetobacter sp. RF15A]|nr:Tn3 family transposase [Acinetobacter sp. RF15A]